MTDKPNDLLTRFRKTPQKNIASGVRDVEGLTSEDEERHQRFLRSKASKVRNKLTGWFLHFLFVLICIVALIAVMGFVFLTMYWISGFYTDPVKLEAFLGQAVKYIVIALATLFLNSLRMKD